MAGSPVSLSPDRGRGRLLSESFTSFCSTGDGGDTSPDFMRLSGTNRIICNTTFSAGIGVWLGRAPDMGSTPRSRRGPIGDSPGMYIRVCRSLKRAAAPVTGAICCCLRMNSRSSWTSSNEIFCSVRQLFVGVSVSPLNHPPRFSLHSEPCSARMRVYSSSEPSPHAGHRPFLCCSFRSDRCAMLALTSGALMHAAYSMTRNTSSWRSASHRVYRSRRQFDTTQWANRDCATMIMSPLVVLVVTSAATIFRVWTYSVTATRAMFRFSVASWTMSSFAPGVSYVAFAFVSASNRSARSVETASMYAAEQSSSNSAKRQLATWLLTHRQTGLGLNTVVASLSTPGNTVVTASPCNGPPEM